MAEALPLVDRITANSAKTVENRILEAQFGNGYKQSTKDGINSDIDHWTIQYAPLEGANLTNVDSFLSTVGVTEWFTWTPIGEAVEKKWTIDKDSINRKMLNTTKFLVSFKMTQDFTLG